jgi:hypothetical protein
LATSLSFSYLPVAKPTFIYCHKLTFTCIPLTFPKDLLKLKNCAFLCYWNMNFAHFISRPQVSLRNSKEYHWEYPIQLLQYRVYPFHFFFLKFQLILVSQFLLLVLSRVLVTNNMGSGLHKRVYLLLIHTTSNYI